MLKANIEIPSTSTIKKKKIFVYIFEFILFSEGKNVKVTTNNN